MFKKKECYKVVEASRIKEVQLPSKKQEAEVASMRASAAFLGVRVKAFKARLATPRSKRRLNLTSKCNESTKRRKSARLSSKISPLKLDLGGADTAPSVASDEEREKELAILKVEKKKAAEDHRLNERERNRLKKMQKDLDRRQKDLELQNKPTPARTDTLPALLPIVPPVTTDSRTTPPLLSSELKCPSDLAVQLLLAHAESSRARAKLEASNRIRVREEEAHRLQRRLYESQQDSMADKLDLLQAKILQDTLRFGR
jgi:hypothetical protein